MDFIILTQNSTPIFKYIVWVLGKIMEGIFFLIDSIGLPNIGLSIILFTIVINLIMLPLTVKQQKFSKLSAKMNPEIQAVQAKYKGKKDNDSMLAQNAEVQAVYAKYGVSPTGSCAYLLIQMPIMFALYRVIQNMPAYVTKIGDTFRVLADKIYSVDGGNFLGNSNVESISRNVTMYGKSFTQGIESGDTTMTVNGIIDVLNKLSTSDIATVSAHYGLDGLTFNGKNILTTLSSTGEVISKGLIDTYNNFLGLNVGNSPWYMIKESWTSLTGGNTKAVFVLIGAILVPVLAAATQWINVKLMPQQDTSQASSGNDQAAAMASSMKTMNTMMPLMSAYFCLTLASGLGLYWIAGAIVRGILQIAINKHIDNMDFDDIIKKNEVKSKKKLEQAKAQQERINAYAAMNTKKISSNPANYKNTAVSDDSNANSHTSVTNAKPGSMMSKANMVKDYNEKNH
ncbi:MAG: YidC/Oxa1 family membrane protein insertase [Acetatifactor sp.]|nr:YidC/Oxa1 family membrane protein insertase [Acetatifactor sp.]